MPPLLVRRVSWLVVLCGAVSVGSLAGTVRADDSETRRRVSAEVEAPIPAESQEEAGSPALQAVGALGIGQIQSTLGLIGVTADAFAKEVYDAKKVEGLMASTIVSLDNSKKQLRKLQDTKLNDDDADFIDRMIGAYNALEREAKALAVFARSRKSTDAAAFAKARKAAIEKIDQLTPSDDVTAVADPPVEPPVEP